jgi:hypothetical protein
VRGKAGARLRRERFLSKNRWLVLARLKAAP